MELSKEEVDKLDREVDAKLAAVATKDNEVNAKRIREEVEKEFTQKQMFEKLQSEQDSMKAELEKSKAEAAKIKEEADKKMSEYQAQVKKEMEEMLAQKRGITYNQSPFQGQQGQVSPTSRHLSDGTVIDVAKLSPDEMKAIEEESMNRFYREVLGREPPPKN